MARSLGSTSETYSFLLLLFWGIYVEKSYTMAETDPDGRGDDLEYLLQATKAGTVRVVPAMQKTGHKLMPMSVEIC